MTLGSLLNTSPPSLTQAEAARLVRSHWGMAGDWSALTSERDLNFSLTTPQGRFVVKLANPAEPVLVTHFQTAALLHLERSAPHLPLPRVIRTTGGATERIVPQGVLRILSYVDGEMMHRAAPSAALRQSVAAMAAGLALGLHGFSHPAQDRLLQWDIKNAAALRPALADIEPLELRALATAALDQFDTVTAPLLPDCRWQVIHADMNPHNVLVDPADHGRVAGVLDFGDMVHTPLICDLAIAASYQIDPAKPLQSLADMAAAFHVVCPLRKVELAVLLNLVEIRMVTTLAITAQRARRYPENAAYILRNVPSSATGLRALRALARGAVLETLTRACGMEHTP